MAIRKTNLAATATSLAPWGAPVWFALAATLPVFDIPAGSPNAAVTFRASPAAPARLWLFTTKSERSFWDARFSDGDGLVFGNDSAKSTSFSWHGGLASKQIDAQRFVTHRFGLSEILDAYDVFGRSAETGALKIALRTQMSDREATAAKERLHEVQCQVRHGDVGPA